MSRDAWGDHLALTAVDALSMDDPEGAARATLSDPIEPSEARVSDTLDRLAVWLAEVSADAALAANGDR